MNIEFKVFSLPSQQFVPRFYDEEVDDIRSILIDVCQFLEDDSEFVISGLGQIRWPLSVGVDFSIFLEQLPELIHAIVLNESTELDLYEQGIERTLIFASSENYYVISCISRAEWQPSLNSEVVNQVDLISMLISVFDKFMCTLEEISPMLVKHPWVTSWAKGRHQE